MRDTTSRGTLIVHELAYRRGDDTSFHIEKSRNQNEKDR